METKTHILNVLPQPNAVFKRAEHPRSTGGKGPSPEHCFKIGNLCLLTPSAQWVSICVDVHEPLCHDFQ